MYVQTYQCKYISDRLRGQELQSLFSTFVKNTHGSKIHYKSTLYTQLKIYFSIAKSMCFSNPENPIVIWQKKFCPYWHKFTRDRLHPPWAGRWRRPRQWCSGGAHRPACFNAGVNRPPAVYW